jgi:hypothetical protein
MGSSFGPSAVWFWRRRWRNRESGRGKMRPDSSFILVTGAFASLAGPSRELFRLIHLLASVCPRADNPRSWIRPPWTPARTSAPVATSDRTARTLMPSLRTLPPVPSARRLPRLFSMPMAKPSALVDTRVIYCGDNLNSLPSCRPRYWHPCLSLNVRRRRLQYRQPVPRSGVLPW